VKTLINRILRPLDVEIRRRSVERNDLSVLDLAVRALIASHNDVFFVQVGANDGLMSDPVREFVDRYRWRGILIEPIPWLFDKLRENYRDHPQVIFENMAISDSREFLTLYTLEQDPDLPNWAHGLTSFSRDILMIHRRCHPRFDRLIKEVRVPSVSLTGMLESHTVQKLDFLSIDTEGYDFEVLKTLDFERFRPMVIQFEHAHLRGEKGRRSEIETCFQWISKFGYRLHTSGVDTTCVRADLL
jgi:FkbM family methyltransferase